MGVVVIVEEDIEGAIDVGLVGLVLEYGPCGRGYGVGGEVECPVLVELAVAQHGLLYASHESVGVDGVNAGHVGDEGNDGGAVVLVGIGSHVEEEGSGVLLARSASEVVVEVALIVGVDEVNLVAAVPASGVGGASHSVAVEYAVELVAGVAGEGLDEAVPCGEEVALAGGAYGGHVAPLGHGVNLVPCGHEDVVVEEGGVLAFAVLDGDGHRLGACVEEELYPVVLAPPVGCVLEHDGCRGALAAGMGVDSVAVAVHHSRLEVEGEVGVFVGVAVVPHREEHTLVEVVVAIGAGGLHAHVGVHGAHGHEVSAGAEILGWRHALYITPVVCSAGGCLGVGAAETEHVGRGAAEVARYHDGVGALALEDEML